MLCLGISAIVFTVRRSFEFYIVSKNYKKIINIWQNLFLPLFPLFLGAVVGWFAKSYPYPQNISSASGRVFFGIVAGMFSGLIYRLLKSILLSNIKATDDSSDNLLNSAVIQAINENSASGSTGPTGPSNVINNIGSAGSTGN
jgi:hypothetical protein